MNKQNFRFKCLLVGLDFFFFLCFSYSFSISFSSKLAVLSLALTHRTCLHHSLFLPRFCLILSPLAVTVWECHMLLVRFSPSFCGWLYSLQESYDQRGYIKILTKRPCVKNSPYDLLACCFQVGNALIDISKEREKILGYLEGG